MHIESCACTAVGRRDSNEDALLHLPCIAEGVGLFAVADGMGGYEGGEVASHLVVSTMEDAFRRYLTDMQVYELLQPGPPGPPMPPGPPAPPMQPGPPAPPMPPMPLGQPIEPKAQKERLLAAAIRLAHIAVAARRSGRLANMGSTVAALVVAEREAILAHVGDSRVYRLRDGRLTQLTRDHSLFEEVRAAGGAQQMESKRDCPFANVITRALGLSDRAEPDVETVPVRSGDLFLLCSDGLSDPLSDAELTRLLLFSRTEGLVGATRRLVQAAYDAGGKDNITAVTVRIG